MSFLFFSLISFIFRNIQLVVTRGDCYTVWEVILENLFDSIIISLCCGGMGAIFNFALIALLNL